MSLSRGKQLEQVLADLKKDYLKALPAKIEKLQTFIKAQQWNSVVEEAHKLKGTGKTYGFPEVSCIAAKIEHLAEDSTKRTDSFFSNAWTLLEEMRNSYLQEKDFDLNSHPLRITLGLELSQDNE